jgi:hypothetical protein
MPPEQTQPNQMTGDQSAAALSFATMLQEQMMPNAEVPQEEPTAPVEPEIAPEQEETEEVVEDTPDLETEFKDFKKETEKMIKKEIGGLKKMIEEALSDEQED